jgi:hypothetical protein
LSSSSAGSVNASSDLIWIDDFALPTFRLSNSEVGTLIYDEALLRNEAIVSVSNLAATRFHSFNERLSYQPEVRADVLKASRSQPADEDNVIIGITSAVRVIGGRRQSLVQIHFKTDRPFPVGERVLQMQVGKRFFVNELSGDHTGRSLVLTLTPEMFTELNDGSVVAAFYDRPDWSGYSSGEIWYFGRLRKDALATK